MSFEADLKDHYADVGRRLGGFGGVTIHTQQAKIDQFKEQISALQKANGNLQQDKIHFRQESDRLRHENNRLVIRLETQLNRIAMLERELGVPTKEDEGRIPSLRCIIQVTARAYDLKVREILSHRRTAPIVFPRHVAMYLCKTLTLCSLPVIGRHFDGRDHTTVLHAVEKMSAMRLADTALDQKIIEIEKLITRAMAATVAMASFTPKEIGL